jgi:hypothetical protein
MRQASKRIPESAEKTVRDIRRATRRHHSAEEKIRIVLELEKAKAWNATPQLAEINAVRAKATKSRSFVVEGF